MSNTKSMNKALSLVFIVSIMGLMIGACAPKNPLVGNWIFHSSGSIYSDNCPLNLEFFNDGTVKSGSASGTYQDMGMNKIMISFKPIDSWTGFQAGFVYDYQIDNDILSFKGNNFYCEFTKPSSVDESENTPPPTVMLQRSSEQYDLLTAVRGQGKIVFTSTRGGLWDIYIMNPDGSDLRLLTDFALSSDCSPDGKQIVATDTAGAIFIINIDGTNRVDVLTTGKNLSPRWSPDAKQILFASNGTGVNEIYIMNIDGSGQIQLTSTGKDNIMPIWTPDGQVAFFAQAEKKYYVMNSDGSNANEIGKETYDGYAREWSPDKSAYVVEMPDPYDIMLFSTDGSVSVRLMEDQEGDFSPTWCP